MPLFGSRREPSPEPVQTYQEPRKNGLFSRREPSPPAQPVYEEPKKQGLFHRRSSPTPTNTTRSSDRTSMSSSTYHTANHNNEGGLFRKSTDASSTRRGGMLHRSFGHGNGHEDDASVLEARQRVQNAEAAEREADRALDEARVSVRDAREHVKVLEEEAREEARRAKMKQHQAREVSKLGKALGSEYF
jgi:hypothetical protein